MNKLDLIIDEIMQARMFIKPKSIADFHTSRAVAAARDLRDMKPVAWMRGDELRDEHGCWNDQRAVEKGWIPLYALEQSE